MGNGGSDREVLRENVSTEGSCHIWYAFDREFSLIKMAI